MKPWRIILSIVVLLITIARFSSTCAKREARDKRNDFVDAVNRIEEKRSWIFIYDTHDKDSLESMLVQTRSFGNTLDSTITYYRNNYKVDEVRYDKYLEVLYEYKKISYLYFGVIGYLKENRKSEKSKEETKRKLSEFSIELRGGLLKLDQKEMEVNLGL